MSDWKVTPMTDFAPFPKQQPQDRRNEDRKIKNNWSVEPAIGVNGERKLVYLKLGNKFDLFIHPGHAVALADALISAVEEEETTTITKRKGQIL